MEYTRVHSLQDHVRALLLTFHSRIDPALFVEFRRVLPGQRFSSLSALSTFHKLLVLQEGTLLSYNLRVLVRVIQGQSPTDSFAGSMERLSPKDASVCLFTAGVMGGRNLGAFAGLL